MRNIGGFNGFHDLALIWWICDCNFPLSIIIGVDGCKLAIKQGAYAVVLHVKC